VSTADTGASLDARPATVFLDTVAGTVEHASEWAIDRLYEMRAMFWRLGRGHATVPFPAAEAERLAALLKAGLIEMRGPCAYAITDEGTVFLQALGRMRRKPAPSPL
jgi:hypothetical protein